MYQHPYLLESQRRRLEHIIQLRRQQDAAELIIGLTITIMAVVALTTTAIVWGLT